MDRELHRISLSDVTKHDIGGYYPNWSDFVVSILDELDGVG